MYCVCTVVQIDKMQTYHKQNFIILLLTMTYTLPFSIQYIWKYWWHKIFFQLYFAEILQYKCHQNVEYKLLRTLAIAGHIQLYITSPHCCFNCLDSLEICKNINSLNFISLPVLQIPSCIMKIKKHILEIITWNTKLST